MSGDVLIVVDMQVGLLDGLPKHDLTGVIQRIKALAAMVRHWGVDRAVYDRYAEGYGSDRRDEPVTASLAVLRAVAATLMTLPVLVLSAFLQRYLRETSLAGVMR